jgi:hypothetical protein
MLKGPSGEGFALPTDISEIKLYDIQGSIQLK